MGGILTWSFNVFVILWLLCMFSKMLYLLRLFKIDTQYCTLNVLAIHPKCICLHYKCIRNDANVLALSLRYVLGLLYLNCNRKFLVGHPKFSLKLLISLVAYTYKSFRATIFSWKITSQLITISSDDLSIQSYPFALSCLARRKCICVLYARKAKLLASDSSTFVVEQSWFSNSRVELVIAHVYNFMHSQPNCSLWWLFLCVTHHDGANIDAS